MREIAGDRLEGVSEGQRDRQISPLYACYLGSARIDALSDRCVIDRCAAEQGVISWTVSGGGERTAGLRPRRIDPGILENRSSFFQALRVSVAEGGVKVPILLWGINGRLYTRYGASRVHTCEGLKIPRIPAVLCLWNLSNGLSAPMPAGFLPIKRLTSPAGVLEAFGPPSIVGDFEVSHERVDAHRLEP